MTDRDLDRDIDPDLDLDLGLLGAEPIADRAEDTGVTPRTGGAHRHRHRKPSRRSRKRDSSPKRDGGRSKSKGRGGRTVAALLVVMLMLGGLGGGIWYGGSRLLSAFGKTPDYAGAGTDAVTVQIMPGDTASDVARTLAKAGVVKSPKAFVSVAQNDPRSTTLQPGTYRLRKQMKASVALDLLFDPLSRLRSRVTLPEGLSVAQSLDRIFGATGIPLAELRAAAKDTTELGLPAYATTVRGRKPGLEGFLYPATYDLEPGMSAVTVLSMMVEKFNTVAAETGFEARAKSVGLKPYQALVVASLVQREGHAADDNPKIARVIYNRLTRDIPLAIDATILYGLGRTSGPLTQADLDKVSPYNTRKVKGLPPTPIASPGKSVIEAILAPAKGNWIYYVLKDEQGHHLFTADYDAFLVQKAKSRAAGLL